jgi:hypothetical protein
MLRLSLLFARNMQPEQWPKEVAAMVEAPLMYQNQQMYQYIPVVTSLQLSQNL